MQRQLHGEQADQTACENPAAPVGAHASPKTSAAVVSGARPAPTVLIMNGPGRLVRARRDRDRAGSGEKRTPHPETVVVVPVLGGVPVAVGSAEVPRIVVPGTAAKDTATRGRPGLRAQGRIIPAAPEDRMAQARCFCILGMRDPGADARIDID